MPRVPRGNKEETGRRVACVVWVFPWPVRVSDRDHASILDFMTDVASNGNSPK